MEFIGVTSNLCFDRLLPIYRRIDWIGSIIEIIEFVEEFYIFVELQGIGLTKDADCQEQTDSNNPAMWNILFTNRYGFTDMIGLSTHTKDLKIGVMSK